MTLEDTANSSVRNAMDQGRQAADKASQVSRTVTMRRSNTPGTRDLSWTCASWCARNRGSQSRPHLRWATSSRRLFGACPEPGAGQ